MDSEKDIEKKLKNRISELGGVALKFHCITAAGFPDRIVLMPKGRVYFLELKSENKKPRKIQNYWAGLLKSLGFFHGVIDTKAGLDVFLKMLQDEG